MTGTTRTGIAFAPVRVERQDLDAGAFVLRSQTPLAPYATTVCHYLERWARQAPERPFLAERDEAGGWRFLGYGEFRSRARAIAAALIRRGVTADRPLMILSDNSLDNALMQFGAMYAGIPAAPVSPAYSLMSRDHARLKYIFDLLRPRLVYALDGAQFAGALAALDLDGVEVVVSRNPPDGVAATRLSALAETPAGDEVEAAFAALGPDTVAKILFTSGSTGHPKGVINSQRMLCANQQAIVQLWPFIAERPPVIVDWLPWHHTFGGNHNFNMVLCNGGTLYVDFGKPAPGLVERTIANLREIAPTLYFNVPRGFDMILPYLEREEGLRRTFFSELDLIFYAAAALPQTTWRRLEALARGSGGGAITLTTAWGSTETAPLATSAHFPLERAGNIGVPAPGTEIKFVPNGEKLELRVRGPNVTPGYYRAEELTRAAFDDDGFYKIGDAGKLADPSDPAKGILFDGRVAEDFKLLTGSWVSVGTLRVAVLAACDPLFQDAVIAGHDRDEVGLLAFPNVAGCAAAAGLDEATPLADLVASEALHARVRAKLAAYNQANPGSSTRIGRAVLLGEPPNIDANEITDKGYINQRAVLERRAALVERLYALDGGDEVLVIGV